MPRSYSPGEATALTMPFKIQDMPRSYSPGGATALTMPFKIQDMPRSNTILITNVQKIILTCFGGI